MPRPKRPVPTPDWVTPEALARRTGERQVVAVLAAPAAPPSPRRPILVASNPAPIDKGMIGHPRPKLAVANHDLDREMAGLLAKFELLEFLDARDDNPNVGG